MTSKEQSNIYNAIQEQHPDVSYYKKEDISMILSKGLSTTVREQPRNPIEFFANWLVEYNKVEKKAKGKVAEQKAVESLKQKHEFYVKSEQAEINEEKKIQDKKVADNDDFWKKLNESEDPFDRLGDFAEYMHRNVGSTGVYIGQLEAPFQKISDDAEDDAHLDTQSAEIIKFKFANKDHQELIVGTNLEPNQGLSHSVFSEEVTTANLELDLEDKTEEEILADFKHKYVPEVVRNSTMHYWKVPRLGSYMAIPLVYRSCLSVDSYTQAIDDFNEYNAKTRKQELDKATFEEQQSALQIEKIGAGETFVPEVKEWGEEIVLPAIKTDLKKFVLCMDTMGQDREFTQSEKIFALQAVQKLKQYWENFESTKLIADRDALIAEKAKDEDIFTDEIIQAFKDKEENMVENKINPPPPPPPEEGKEVEKVEATEEDPEPVDTEKKAQEITQMRIKFQLDLLKDNETFKERFDQLTSRKIVKHHKLFKCIFYLLEFESDSICVEKTQLFFWKKARHHWNDALIEKMSKFRFLGKKDHGIMSYQTINYLEKNLEGLSQDSISSYNYSLGLIYKWMTMIISSRKKDIISRLNDSKIKREERQQRIEEDKQRTEDRAQALEDAKEKFEVENKTLIEKYNTYQEQLESEEPPELEEGEEAPMKPEFDEKFFLYTWDDEHPVVVIPKEVIDDMDNDWIITADKKDDMITEFAQAKADETALQASLQAAEANTKGKK